MKLRFLWTGKTKDPAFKALEKKYLKRIGQFLSTEVTHVAESPKKDPRKLVSGLEEEARRIEKKLEGPNFVVCLDESGRHFTSEELADFMEKRMLTAVNRVTFVIGGFWGLPPRILDRADECLALSRMTLPHELARVVLLEQVYRAMAILRNLPYHK